ncbi:hypothetical protein, partial [Stenotrophomonas sp.]|uniref:hypothetical protein n=1 Tax=Stenotrophomonas sp. TaxID=69392 RepID=UPI0028B2144F
MSVAACPDVAAARRCWRCGGVLLALLAALPVRADDCSGPLRLVHASAPSSVPAGQAGPVHGGIDAML